MYISCSKEGDWVYPSFFDKVFCLFISSRKVHKQHQFIWNVNQESKDKERDLWLTDFEYYG